MNGKADYVCVCRTNAGLVRIVSQFTVYFAARETQRLRHTQRQRDSETETVTACNLRECQFIVCLEGRDREILDFYLRVYNI